MPAAKGGVRRGDVIIEFDNVRIRDVKHLRDVVASTEVGRTVEVKVIRKGKEKVLKIELEKRTQAVVDALTQRPTPFVSDEENAHAFTGLHVRDLTNEWAARYGFEDEKGVLVVSVEPRSAAAEAGMRRGDLIQEIEDTEIANVSEYQKRIREVKDENLILLVIRRSATGAPQFITLRNKPRDN
jgi:serine protease Do